MKLTITEAAAHCGYKTRTVIYRLQRDGLLRDYEAGRQGRSLLLETHPPGRCSLRDHIAACVQLRHDSPLLQPRRPMAELTDAELGAYTDQVMAGLDAVELGPDWPKWSAVAEQLNAYLGDSWPAPPYSAAQAATLAMCLSLAQEAAGGG
jgi:hypothetical protein